ncbi:MAG: OsmC family protein [Gaiellaceae bacterium]
MAGTPRVYEFEVTVDGDRTARSGLGGEPIARADEWWAEHLVLAGLVRCTLASMDYSARRAGLRVVGSGRANGRITKRDADGLYAFVDLETHLEIELDPTPERQAVEELLAKAERGCFVGNSLTPRPRYRWTVNGEAIP